jgi:uncharacterized membrane protein YjfL (UPF0719 family)
MNTNSLYLGVIEVFIGLLFGILLCFVVFWLMRRLFTDKLDVKFDNLAFGILIGFVLLSVAEMVDASLHPAMDYTRRLINMGIPISELITKACLIIFCYFLSSTIVSMLIILLSFTLFSWLTVGLNEYEEIKNKNIAVAVISGVIMYVITRFIAGGMELVFQSFIPYPEMPRVF